MLESGIMHADEIRVKARSRMVYGKESCLEWRGEIVVFGWGERIAREKCPVFHSSIEKALDEAMQLAVDYRTRSRIA